jgi:hypothetical protein
MADVIHRVKYRGSIVEVRGPEDATPAELMQVVQGYKAPEPPRPAPVVPKPKNLTAKEVAYGAVTNIPSSAVQLAKDVITPFVKPVETISNLAALGGGVLSKLGVGNYDQTTANAVGTYLVDRYGGVEQLKRTLATDPIGLLADASTIFTGGGALAARVPGAVGRTGRVVGAAGRAIDPLALAVKGTKAAAATRPGRAVLAPVRTAASLAGTAAAFPAALASGVPISQIKQAATINPKMGAAVERHMKGTAPLDEPLKVTKEALKNMRKEGIAEYKAGIGRVTKDPTFISIKAIRKAVSDAENLGKYHGVNLDDAAVKVWGQVKDKVEEFAKIPGGQGRTVEGLDKLKRSIYKIGKNQPFDTTGSAVAKIAYGAVKDAIATRAPGYAAVMKPYETMSETVDDIERALSLGSEAQKDTAIRKLQSIARNNSSTNYGRRAQQLESLAKYGAEEVPYMLAGQALSSVEPRGLARLGGEGIMAASFFNKAFAPLMALSSPRFVGEAARAASRLPALASKYKTGYVPLTSAQIGRGSESVEDQAYRRLFAEYLYPQPTRKSPPNNPFAEMSDEELRALIQGPIAIEADETATAAPPLAEPLMTPGPDLQ